jgi:hypothetical protein
VAGEAPTRGAEARRKGRKSGAEELGKVRDRLAVVVPIRSQPKTCSAGSLDGLGEVDRADERQVTRESECSPVQITTAPDCEPGVPAAMGCIGPGIYSPGRWHSRPARAQFPPHGDARRFDAQESGEAERIALTPWAKRNHALESQAESNNKLVDRLKEGQFASGVRGIACSVGFKKQDFTVE